MSTSLAQQLQKLATPHTKLLIQRNKKPSLLFDPSEAASIDRTTFYEIGIGGLNELIEINDVFEEFRNSLFDESLKTFERALETFKINQRLNDMIKKFLYLLSPYFMLKPSQKVLEWLIVRFHIQDYNTDELLCTALSYHGTRLFARLLQVFDLETSKTWQWLYPLQKKGIPLSKIVLFNHCSSDAAFLKMICDFTIDAVEFYGRNSSKLTTVFGFYSTTIVGALHSMSEITELQLTYLLPSLLKGLSSSSDDYTASAFVIISVILTKSSFQLRLHKKFVKKITEVKHDSLKKSIVVLLNILYQNYELGDISISTEAIKNLEESSQCFIPTLGDFLSSGNFPNTFYLTLIHDTMKILQESFNENQNMVTFLENLIETCKVNEETAEKLMRIIIKQSEKNCPAWACKLVQHLEYQYPVVWDDVISSLLKEYPCDSLSEILGLTSVTSQVQIFEKLHHSNPAVRKEAIKYIAENGETVKVKYIENGLLARWEDEDPSVVEAMFLLPASLSYYNTLIRENLLLKCWLNSSTEWNAVLLKIIESFKSDNKLGENCTRYTVLLVPFLICGPKEVQKEIINIDLPLMKWIKCNLKTTVYQSTIEALKNPSVLPKIADLLHVYDELPQKSVYIFTLLLLLSEAYVLCNYECKLKLLECVFERIFPSHFKKTKWRMHVTWNSDSLADYYRRATIKIPKQIIYKFFISILEHMSVPEQLCSAGWCDFLDDHCNLIASLYEYMNNCSQLNNDSGCNFFVSFFVEKHFVELPKQINFLLNMCMIRRENVPVTLQSFKMINYLLKKSNEYSWMLNMNVDNIVVPSLLVHLYSTSSQLRDMVMRTIMMMCTVSGPAIPDDTSYLELFKHLLTYKEEIIFDREQLPSVIYGFLSQDKDVQALLPIPIRYFTKRIFDALFECIIHDSIPLSVSASLLPVVEYLQEANVMYKLMPLLQRILKSSDYPNEAASHVIRNVINKFSPTQVAVFDNADVRQVLEFCLTNSSTIKVRTVEGVVCLGTILLQKISAGIYDVAEEPLQKYFLNAVLKLGVSRKHIDLSGAVNSFLKKITLDCALLVEYLKAMKGLDLINIKLADEFRPIEWSMGIALLEVVQNKKKIYNCQCILPLLFDVLQKCCEVDDKFPMEYAKQICLSSLLNCSQKLSQVEKMEKLFDVQLVVNCIRTSPSPQTHHHALLFLAHCVSFAPGQVLHNIMAIFTFMGSSVLRQDDEFSFQIISNILDTIVPLLVKEGETRILSVYNVLKVFAVSIPDIPEHRRRALLMKLMKILNEGEYLYALVLLALERGAKTTNKTEDAKYMDVMVELVLGFPVVKILSCTENILLYANSVPHNIDEEAFNLPPDRLLDIKTLKNKDLHHFKYLMLNFIACVLSKSEFIHQISKASLLEMKHFEIHFTGMIEQIILYLKSITEYVSDSRNGSPKYWKGMSSQALDVLNKTNALLTCKTFVAIIEGLLNHKSLAVQRKTLELLNWRIQQTQDDTIEDKFSPDDLVSLVPALMKIVSTITKRKGVQSSEVKLNQQIASISIRLLVKYYYSPEYCLKFKKVSLKLSSLLTIDTISDHVLACFVLCISELIAALKVHTIEALPKFVPVFLDIFKRYRKKEIVQNDVLLLSIIMAMQKLVETLANFLSPYLESILFEIACIGTRVEQLECKLSINEDTKNSTVVHKLKLIRQKLSEIPSRVLLPSLSSCFTKLSETRNFVAIKSLMDILAESFPKNGHFSTELTSLFLSTLEFRCNTDDQLSDEEIYVVETYIIEALCKIVLKCSESTFRPFYHKFYDWGVITSKERSKRDRIITYYRVLYSISEKLKSIFVLFASNFIRNAAELLAKCNMSHQEEVIESMGMCEKKIVLLVDSILGTLFNIFKYNSLQFLTKDRFDMLLEPLVNQIENMIGDYLERSKTIVIPCVARFAAATTDETLWKSFNYCILLKTRHSSPQVRLAALETVYAFATHLGDNFLPFLPETVPFLAELLEDENENVEKHTKKVVQQLEQVLQEPIQKYF